MSTLRVESEAEAWSGLGSWMNRRAYARVRCRGTVSIRAVPTGCSGLGRLLDLSKGGCGVELEGAFAAEANANVELEIFVRGVPLFRSGIIRYLKPASPSMKKTHLGIEFVEDGSADVEQFHRYTKELLSPCQELRQDDVYEPILRKLWTHFSRSGQ